MKNAHRLFGGHHDQENTAERFGYQGVKEKDPKRFGPVGPVSNKRN